MLRRDRLDLFFTLVFPLIFALFFGTIYSSMSGGEFKMSVAVVNEDGGLASLNLARDLGLTAGLEVQAVQSRAQAEDLVRKGKVAAAIIIPPGFQQGFDNIFLGQGIKLDALVDPSRRTESGLLQGKLNELAFIQFGNTVSDPTQARKMIRSVRASMDNAGQDPDADADSIFSLDPARKLLMQGVLNSFDSLLADMERKADPAASAPKVKTESAAPAFRPVEVTMSDIARTHDGPTNAYELSFPQGVVWALMGCVTSFAGSLVGERTKGTLLRLSVAPIARGHILLGKGLACFLTCLTVQGLLLFIFMIPGFGVRVQSPLLMVAAMLCSAVAFTGVVMLVSTMARTEGGSGGAGRALILVLAMIGGGTIPVAFMPGFLRTASNVSPFTWAVRAIEGALWRGYTPADMLVPCGILLAFGVVGFVLGSRMFRWAA